MDVITFILFFSYSKILNSSCNDIVRSYTSLQQTVVSVERALKILGVHSLYTDNQIEIFPPDFESITIDHLEFCFDENIIFKDFNIKIHAKQCIVIAGRNGSGKTTLLNLLAGVFYSSGSIKYGATDVNKILPTSIQKEISYYYQDDTVFDITIRENILCFDGAEKITEKQLFAVCKRVRIIDDILALESGFDTLLSEAKAFSFGQRRKLLLVRVLLKPSSIVLFDEPLAGLDHDTQLIIIEEIMNMRERKTIVIATHRPELFAFCDQMIKL